MKKLLLVLLSLALMSKPMMVTLPCVLLLLDYWPLERQARGRDGGPGRSAGFLALEKLPLFLLSAACSAVTRIITSRHTKK